MRMFRSSELVMIDVTCPQCGAVHRTQSDLIERVLPFSC